MKQTEETLTLHLDKKYHHPVDTVIVLEIEGDSMELDAIDTRHFVGGMVSIDAAASASSMNHSSGKGNPGAVIYGSDEAEEIELYYGEAAEYIDQETIGEKKIVQKKEFKTNKHRKKGKWGNTHGHHWRYWAAKPDDITPWIEVDLGKPKWVGRIVMQEKCSRITVAEGTSLGMFNLKLPEAVLTQKVRLQVTDSTPVQGSLHEGAAIHTFDIFGPDPIHTEPGAQP